MSAASILGPLAVVVTRGSSNNLFQVATLVRAATALEASVRVLFRGEAVAKLARSRINADDWSPAYDPIKAELAGRLKAADFVDMESFLRDAKEHGDDVQLWVSAEALAQHGLQLSDLVSTVDGAASDAELNTMAASAQRQLEF